MKSNVFFLPIAIVAALALFIVFIKPDWEVYKQKRKELETVEEKVSNLNQKSNQAKQALGQLKSMNEANRTVILDAVSKTKREPEFIAEISKIVDSSGVLFGGLSISKSQPISNQEKKSKQKDEAGAGGDVQAGLNKISLQLAVSGDYLQLRKFIYKLEKMNRFASLENASFSGGDNDNLVKLGVKFNVYHQPYPGEKTVMGSFPDGVTWQKLTKEGIETDFAVDYSEHIEAPYTFSPDLEGLGKQDLFAVTGMTRETQQENIDNQTPQTQGEETAAELEGSLQNNESPEKEEEDQEELK
ncbi:MAG: hypothetical protein U5L10_05750 [Candidatus Moranbacteria bacterium]|nr:hypothetical protein [Candidatus Moranbacteria bacterium]